MIFNVEIKGLEELRRKLASGGPAMVKQGAAALYQEALVEKIEMIHRCPKDTGNLRDSHEVLKPVIDGSDVSVSIMAGGPAAPYGLFVHENLEAHHAIGEAKWMERTIHESAPFLAERIAKRIDLNSAAG